MKKLAILATFLVVVAAAFAGDVLSRNSITLTTSGGAGTWTNTYQYASVKVQRIGIAACIAAIDTVTVTRVTGETKAETNTVCAIVLASNYGAMNLDNTNSVSPVYMLYGDKLVFDSFVDTGATVYVECIVSKH